MADDAAAAGAEVTDVQTTAAVTVEGPQDVVDHGRAGLRTRLVGTPMRQAAAAGLAMVLVLAGLVAGVGWRAYTAHQSAQERARFLEAGRQAALDLTTMDFTSVDATVARLLSSSTGKFHDDFQQRSQPLAEMVKKTQSTSVGSIAEAGLQSVRDGGARVLVAVQVTTTSPVDPNAGPTKGWRMLVDVQRVGSAVKIANVEFVR